MIADADISTANPVLRSVLFVPATSDRFITSALRQPADALQIDLEDGVAADQKAAARLRVAPLARGFAAVGHDVFVRVNRDWRLLVRDLEASVSANVSTIVLPKVPNAAMVREVAEVVRALESVAGMPDGHTQIIPMVEDAEGLHEIADIARAHPRVRGITLGAEDLATSLCMRVDEDGLYTPSVMAVVAARRAGIVPLGFVGSVADFADEAEFQRKLIRARALGFEGCFCIHPKQVAIANAAFAPDLTEVEHAKELIAEFEAQSAFGRGAFSFKGRMVDLPVVERARGLIKRNESIDRRRR